MTKSINGLKTGEIFIMVSFHTPHQTSTAASELSLIPFVFDHLVRYLIPLQK